MEKKLLDRPFFAGILIPIGLVLLAVMIIWGVTKMLTVERTHRDLIAELHSKNFGNRWIYAYELAKLFSNYKLPYTE